MRYTIRHFFFSVTRSASTWLLVSAGFPILARAARDDEQRLGYALQKIFEVAVVLGVFLGLGLAVAAPLAIEVVAGKAFDASVPVLRLQAAGLVTSFLMVTWTYALLSLKLYRPLLIANAAAAVVALRRHRPALTPDLAVVPKVIAAFAIALTVALVVPAPVLVLSMLAGGAYGAVVLLLGAVPPEAIAALRRRA